MKTNRARFDVEVKQRELMLFVQHVEMEMTYYVRKSIMAGKHGQNISKYI